MRCRRNKRLKIFRTSVDRVFQNLMTFYVTHKAFRFGVRWELVNCSATLHFETIGIENLTVNIRRNNEALKRETGLLLCYISLKTIARSPLKTFIKLPGSSTELALRCVSTVFFQERGHTCWSWKDETQRAYSSFKRLLPASDKTASK